MVRLAAIVVLLMVIYASTGVAIYFSDLARHWCGFNMFYWAEAVWYAFFWPFRLISGALCGN